jgi:dipeptidyl aminopeptidase/acylaminoacyl peptidase
VDGEGALFVVPFDPKAAEVTGPARPITQGIATSGIGGARLAVSRSGSMVYQPDRGAGSATALVELDRTGRNTGRIDLRGDIRSPRWSPTRDRVAFTKSDDGTEQIWTYDVGGKTMTPLRVRGSASRASWSPDGRQLAFLLVGDGGGSIWTIPADGSGPATPAVPNARSGGAPNWSRDGKWIAFDGPFTAAANVEDVYAVSTEGERRVVSLVATQANEESGVISPNGRWVAYVSNEAGPSQVYLRPFMRPGGRWLVSTGEAGGPLWTTDNELVYSDAPTESLMSARLAFDPDPRVLGRTSLIDWKEYLPSGRSVQEYDISRDGQRILALRVGGAEGSPSPVVVLNWKHELRRLMAPR